MAKKFSTYDEARAYVNTLPIQEIVDGYAKALYETEKVEQIRISEAQFQAFFRIIGKTSDGTVENRGRKKLK